MARMLAQAGSVESTWGHTQTGERPEYVYFKAFLSYTFPKKQSAVYTVLLFLLSRHPYKTGLRSTIKVHCKWRLNPYFLWLRTFQMSRPWQPFCGSIQYLLWKPKSDCRAGDLQQRTQEGKARIWHGNRKDVKKKKFLGEGAGSRS